MPLARFTVTIINSPRANNQLEMRLNFSKIATIYNATLIYQGSQQMTFQ